ncbi:MOSC domain-containing protein [Acetobacterium bakii]|uniref:Transposase n=1 Tax=Acetobacterium bakii TaxID=52689 RepID=A0A0L6U4X7_9FIRM|nr:MOSC domain-containing protein [Acetobacterium bakii]KNZ43367.1 transposase [Acetobacterium bakii]
MGRRGKITAICTSVDKGTPKRNIHQAMIIKKYGVEADAHASFKSHRQVSLLSYEKIEEFKAKGAEIKDGAFGENMIVQEIDFTSYPIGTQFRSGDVILELTQIGKECHDHCQIYETMGECIMPKDGVFCKVIMGGIITEGDYLHVED